MRTETRETHVYDKYHETKASIAATLSRIISEMTEANRGPTDDEAAWIEAARMSLGDIPRPGEEMPKMRLSQTRRRKPKRRGDESDAASDP